MAAVATSKSEKQNFNPNNTFTNVHASPSPQTAAAREMENKLVTQITSYLTRPNVINIARPKLGRMVRLYPHFKINALTDPSSVSTLVFKVITLLKV
jgi:hypothetical protein